MYLCPRFVFHQHIRIFVRSYSAKPMKSKKRKSAIDYATRFVDWKRISCKAGDGGNGMLCFLRVFCNPLAGPSGGDGGNGGHVIFRASRNVKSLEHVPALIKAGSGSNGQNNNCHGASAKHTFVDIPIGSTIKTDDGVIVADLDKEGTLCVAAHGGAGGRGNQYYLSNENRHPSIAEVGGIGENKAYVVELKVMAHAGLIGFPNAGKSTLLQAISRARPKVAAYPFTTLNPHVGMVQYDDHEQIAVADLPGLIVGSHQDKGLGIGFLKHVERCLCLLYVIDLSEECPIVQLDSLKHELEMFSSGLSKRPHAIVGNKIDLESSQKNLEVLQAAVNLPIFAISAKFGQNMTPFLHHLRSIYDKNIAN